MEIAQKEKVTAEWFKSLRDKICQEFEKIEEEYLAQNTKNNFLLEKPLENAAPFYDKPQKFVQKQWLRNTSNNTNEDANNGGGGEMSVMKGNVFEKVGVNISTVFGEFSPEFRKQIPGTENNAHFFATGISLVAHMASPLVPAVHMNTRFIHTQKDWFGGGADLNPMFEKLEDVFDFHLAFKNACDSYDKASGGYKETFHIKSNDTANSTKQQFTSSYEKFKKECDDYFFIKHRNISRGAGGIFYDYLNSEKSGGNFENDFEFTKNVGLAFLKIFPKLVRKNMFEPYNQEQRNHQLKKRGHYAEFNLLYDRGTKFGLMTGGNTEAILMSLPPLAKWE